MKNRLRLNRFIKPSADKMANCANKNAPEFKKLVNLTGLNPDEVSLAIGMWQDHNNSESWPSSAQIISMYANRQTYGGMDKYLAAVSKPVEKYDLQKAAENLPGRMQSILNALGSLIPDIRATIHATQEEYAAAVSKVSSNKQAQNTNGFYDPKTKQIHLNLTRMVITMGLDKKRALNTAEHEAVHPILEMLETVNPGAIGAMFKDLQQVEKQLGYDGHYTVTFAGRYPIEDQQEEAITEFIADVASGNIDLSKLNKTQIQRIADFFINAFKLIGIDLSKLVKSNSEIVTLAKDINALFNGGKRDIKLQATNSEAEPIKGKSIADGAFMKAPNGKPTNLTERQWVQVRTKEFKDWFGDWEKDPKNDNIKFQIHTNQHTNLATIKQAPGYRKAKAGDPESAKKVVNSVYKKEKHNILNKHSDAIVLPVLSLEESGTNAIPLFYAKAITEEYGIKLNKDIYVANKPQHTGKGAMYRLMSPPIFEGKVIRGGKYFIVDDVSTTGSTLNELKKYIESNGGAVIGAGALASQYGGINFIPNKLIIKQIYAKFGQQIDKILSENGIADTAEQLTDSQAKYIFKYFNDAFSLRKGILAFGDQQTIRIRHGNEGAGLKFQASPDNLIYYTEKFPYMTVEGKKYVFFNYDSEDKSKFHTEPLPFMVERGYQQRVVRVPTKEVYPFEEDPLKLRFSGDDSESNIRGILLKAARRGYKMIVGNANNKLVAIPTSIIAPIKSNTEYKSIAVQESNISNDIDRVIQITGPDPEKLRPFRNYSVELDNALKNYDITRDLNKFESDLDKIKKKNEAKRESIPFNRTLSLAEERLLYNTDKKYRDLFDKDESGTITEEEREQLSKIYDQARNEKYRKLIQDQGKKFTIYNDLESLKAHSYLIKDGAVRVIISTRKINPLRTEYSWINRNNSGIVYRTVVDQNGKETTNQVENPIKFSLGHTDNSDDSQPPYEQALRFGRLVNDLVAKIKEGITDLPQLRDIAGVTADTYELFEQAYDLAWVRAGNNPTNTRQHGLYKMIRQLPEGDQRPTAQEMYRIWKPLLDDLDISQDMLKQILPDEHLLEDKNLNQTWRRIVKVIDDVGAFVSQTIDRGKKFTITDFEGINSQHWDHTAIGFSDMLASVENAVQANPENKAKLLANVRAAIKEDPDSEMLQLLEVAISASGPTDLNDLSKVIRSGTLAGRVLNVIKRYIGGENFGKVKADLAAATIMSENDDVLASGKTGTEQDAITLLDLAEEIRDILALSKMTTEEREEFFKENEGIVDRIHRFLKDLDLSKGHKAPNDKRATREAKAKISKGVALLINELKKTSPELIKLSKTEYEPETLKAVKQIVRGIIDLHGSDKIKLAEELDNVFADNGILISAADILNNQAIKDYIANVDRHRIREGVIREMQIEGDPYSKMILDSALKSLNASPEAKNKKDILLDALDRGELTKEILDNIKAEINKISDPDKRQALLNKLNDKFIVLFNSAIPAKALADVVSEGIGAITRDIVSNYIADPDKSLSMLTANAMDQLGLSPQQAVAWAKKIREEVQKKLNKAKKAKIKSLLRQKVSNKSKAESIEEKIFKIISEYAEEDGSIPSATQLDEQMLDIKQVIANKYGKSLNDPKAIAEIVKLTNLLRVARTSARRAQIHAKIMLKIKNMNLSPNRYVRVLKSGISEVSNFVMANILSGVNSAYKALIGGFYNSARAYFYDAIIGRGVDWVYNTKDLTRQTVDMLKDKKSKNPANHMMIAYHKFYDVMRNGSAAISQANIPEHGLSNFDDHLNNVFLLRTLYAPYRFLSAIDIATMTLNQNRLAYRKAINNVIEYGRSNVVLNGQPYQRTAGGASWYMLDAMGTPKIDSRTGNIEIIRDPRLKKILNEKAKESVTTTEFLGEVEQLLGTNRINQYHEEMVDEWNALVDLANSQTATKEEKEELKRLGLYGQDFKKVNSIDDFKSMSGAIKRFIAGEIHKKITQNMNAVIQRDVNIETGGYSAQGIEIPGVPAGILYQFATILDNVIQTGLGSGSQAVKFIIMPIAIAAKLYSFLITKAPAIGYGTALMFTPISFLMNLVNLMTHFTGRPFMRITYDAKVKAWRYNGLTLKDIENATGVSTTKGLGVINKNNVMITTDEDVLRVLKEGYTVVSQDQNEFELKPSVIKTIGGQKGSIEIGSILAKQALATAAFMTLLGLMFDCPEDEDCEMNEFGKKVFDIFSLRGYGAMKNWLETQGFFERYVGHRAVLDKFGDPHKQTVRLSPQIGEVELKMPLNEMNNSVAATTLTRIKDEMAAGVKLTRSDIALRYMIYSNFDLLEDNLDISVDGLDEFKELFLAFFDETYNRDKKINKATSSITKRIASALIPKMFNDLDKMLLDKGNVYRLSVEAEGWREQLAKKAPLNVPFLRRYMKENDPETYSDSPFQYEWTDWQFFIKRQKEEGITQDFGLDTGKYIINPSGRTSIKAPEGEVDKIKKEAAQAGKGNDYAPNGWFNITARFDSIFSANVKESNINELIDAGNKEGVMDLLRDIAKKVKDDKDFQKYKKGLILKPEPGQPVPPNEEKE